MWTTNTEVIMNRDDFEKLYLCEWKPDPILQECVAFMRYATPKEIHECKRDGLFDGKCIREAKRIIEQEKHKETEHGS
jgi:bacterioferritin-associated ferredoxin